ncbi:hypothetical protein ACFE33_09580 [Falsihalocynthiibacter sp. SS001]|uniref:hypothetical protein n=1 Tax=Falsihalocynthiibacter sp. SS001 TaxID=3349698 RepID=UPI0036D2A998
MSEIVDYERRITAALSKISETINASTAKPAETAPDQGAIAALEKALESERTVNAQLEARVIAIKTTQEETVTNLEKRVAELQVALKTVEADALALKNVNAQLRENNAALRDAATANDPEVINKSMEAELVALRAVHTADRNEMDGLLGELSEIIGEEA